MTHVHKGFCLGDHMKDTALGHLFSNFLSIHSLTINTQAQIISRFCLSTNFHTGDLSEKKGYKTEFHSHDIKLRIRAIPYIL